MNYLLPHGLKKVGWILFIPAFVLLLIQMYGELGEPAFLDWQVFALYNSGIEIGNVNTSGFFKIIDNNIADELLGVLAIVGLLFIAFSKEPIEDEFIKDIRLKALMKATWINYLLLLGSIILIYGMAFYTVMLFNLLTVLIIFIIQFEVSKLKLRGNHEE